MDMRIITILFLAVCSVSSAEVYKCKLNGDLIFSDQLCGQDAEKVEIKVYQPKIEDVDRQRRTTKHYTEESQYDEWDALIAKSDTLNTKISQLEKQCDAELQVLNEKYYEYSETLIATSEHDLFQRIDDVKTDYQRKINRVKTEIGENKVRMFNLKSLIDAQKQ